MILEELNDRILKLEAKFANRRRLDGATMIEAFRVVLHPDGSGSVEAWVRKCPPDEPPDPKPDTRKMLRRVFAEWEEYFGFESLDELDAMLSAMGV